MEVLYILSKIKEQIVIKITSVTFYEGKERVDLVIETNIKYGKIGGYTSNTFCKDIVCED